MSNFYAPAWGFGGPVRVLHDYAHWLDGWAEVQIATTDLNHDYRRLRQAHYSCDPGTVRRHRLILPRLGRRAVYLVPPTLLLDVATRIGRWRGPAVLHTCDVRGILPLYAIALKRTFGHRLLHIHSAFGMLHEKPSPWRKLYDAGFGRAFFRAVDVGLAQNAHEERVYCTAAHRWNAACRVEVLPLHAAYPDPSHFLEERKRPAIRAGMRQKYGIPGDAAVFVFVGRFHEAKGIGRLIDAYSEFKRRRAGSSVLLIVGRDHGYEREMSAKIAASGVADSIRVLRDIYDERFELYYLADAFVGFPTIFEETMLAAVEALASGTPPIVSEEADMPGVAEAATGYVLRFRIDDVVDAMANVVEDAAGYGQRARRLAVQRFAPGSVAANLRWIIHAGLAAVGEQPTHRASL